MEGMSTSQRFSSFSRRLKDACVVAFIALLLGIPMIGLTTGDSGGTLVVLTRFGWLAVFVVMAFAGRILFCYLLEFYQHQFAHRGTSYLGSHSRQIVKTTGWFLVGIALFAPLFYSDDRYVLDTATNLLIYVMLGWGLNIVVGLAGLLDLGYVAFYAVGAYTYALLALHFDWTFWEAFLGAGLSAAAFGILLGYPILRLRGDYLAIVTLGFGEIIRVVLINWHSLTGGPNGIGSIPRPTFFGLPFERSAPQGQETFAGFFGLEFSAMHRMLFLYYLILVMALLTNVFILRMRRLPVGRAWEALREDEIACRAMGMNTTNIKLSAFAIGAMLGGFAGIFFASKQGFVSPESFVFSESAIILAIVVLGGMGSQLGVVLASIILVLLPELGREFEQYRMLIFGAAMVFVMVWRPGGLLSRREATISLAVLRKREARL